VLCGRPDRNREIQLNPVAVHELSGKRKKEKKRKDTIIL
jgi:hypothetical protein